ncbi:MAG: type I-MYXAN CRISPR-associated protein Cas6/Cmx6 [Thioploca sp.]|nr:type I-MYXAN CRISPR-associated protein Cas6/Cmx6 [Thioploca sp.]
MLWQEEVSPKEIKLSPEIVDLVFDIHCQCLPVDHAYALSQTIQQSLPWFEQELQAGLHLIHGAESGNGWYRPNGQDELLYLSRRTKLTLRLPQYRITAATRALTNLNLDIAGYSLTVNKAVEKPLNPMPVLLARHVIADPKQDEEIFLEQVVMQLELLGIPCRKALCGKTHYFKLPEGELFTRSLMIADLKPSDSLMLQQQGLGSGRKMGCGLFIPHKDIKPVNPDKN